MTACAGEVKRDRADRSDSVRCSLAWGSRLIRNMISHLREHQDFGCRVPFAVIVLEILRDNHPVGMEDEGARLGDEPGLSDFLAAMAP